MKSRRLFGAVVMGLAMTPVLATGCDGSDPTNPTGTSSGLIPDNNPLGAVCCDEFKVGAGITGDIGGSAESKVAVQAVSDFAGIASAAIDDITTACRGIATDLDAPQADRDAAEAITERNGRMDAWCKLAVRVIGTVKATAKATIKVTPPVCEASVSAKANCQAQCSGSAKCDVQANPPTCEGGKLQVSCSGSCSGQAGASVSCEGTCDLNCTGSCTAQGGVRCQGKCEGTCTATGSATGQAFNAQGDCVGTCQGTCSATAPNVKCEGSCNGQCSGKCVAKAGASVKCDGQCDAQAEPLRCEGGTLKGGCQVEAKCDANCDASVKAKAECHPPAIDFAFTGDAQAAGKLRATLDANLGVVAAFQARLEAMGEIAGTFTGNISAVTDIKVACIPPVIAAAATAVGQVQASASASLSIVTAATGS